jgi:hypothetical protein
MATIFVDADEWDAVPDEERAMLYIGPRCLSGSSGLPAVQPASSHPTSVWSTGRQPARWHGQVFVSVIAYQPGRPNSNDGLRQDLSSALNDLSLTGTYL